jgi:hypothetical protein
VPLTRFVDFRNPEVSHADPEIRNSRELRIRIMVEMVIEGIDMSSIEDRESFATVCI